MNCADCEHHRTDESVSVRRLTVPCFHCVLWTIVLFWIGVGFPIAWPNAAVAQSSSSDSNSSFSDRFFADENLEAGQSGRTTLEPEDLPRPLTAPAPVRPEDTSMWSMAIPRRGSAIFTYLAGGGDDGLGSVGLDTSITFLGRAPLGHGSYFSVTPNFGFQTLDGVPQMDLPSELYRASITFAVTKPLSENKQLTIALSPGFLSDAEGGKDAFRMIAFGNLAWQTSPTMKWMFGVAVTGRQDIPVLPMAGFVWTPSEDWQYEMTLPRPRISHRIDWLGADRPNWLYVAGEFGGGTWAVERNGRPDELTMRDFRLVAGWELRDKSRFNPHVEAGYVFGRKLEYESDGASFVPASTVMVRAGFSF